jgi:predicted transcriptional regulator
VNDNGNKKLIAENAFLKSKIAYSIGSLETICYLLKNEDSDTLNKNLDHLRSTVNRVLEDLRKDF